MGGEFWAAIAGAVVGGLISFCVQLITLRDARGQRDKIEGDRNKALAHSLLFKMMRIFSNIKILGDYIEHSLREGERAGIEEPWQCVMPQANDLERVIFLSEEMSMLLSLQDDDLFNDIASFDQVHNAILATFETYKTRRLLLTDNLPVQKVLGGKIITPLTDQQITSLKPKTMALNSIIISLQKSCARDMAQAENVLNRMAKLLRDKIGISTRIETKLDKVL